MWVSCVFVEINSREHHGTSTPMIGNIAIKTEAQTVFNVNDIKRPSFYSSLFTCILFGKIETHGCNVRWIFRWFIHHNETNVEHTETEDVQLKMVMVHFIAELWHSQWNIVFKTNGTYNGARNDAWWESEMCFLKIHTTQLFHILKWNSGIAAIPEISPCARATAIYIAKAAYEFVGVFGCVSGVCFRTYQHYRIRENRTLNWEMYFRIPRYISCPIYLNTIFIYKLVGTSVVAVRIFLSYSCNWKCWVFWQIVCFSSLNVVIY